jgi:hypothetical protein
MIQKFSKKINIFLFLPFLRCVLGGGWVGVSTTAPESFFSRNVDQYFLKMIQKFSKKKSTFFFFFLSFGVPWGWVRVGGLHNSTRVGEPRMQGPWWRSGRR